MNRFDEYESFLRVAQTGSFTEAAAGLGVPEYLVSDVGPDHAKEFSAEAVVGGEVLGEGTGRSKKVAEQRAAASAYERILAAHPGLEAPTG